MNTEEAAKGLRGKSIIGPDATRFVFSRFVSPDCWANYADALYTISSGFSKDG